MSRIAIVVAVSEYQAVHSLPACRQDGVALADLLKRTGRFDEVVHISGGNETLSSSVKSRLSATADQFRGSPVEEILFYFSGHGDFDGDDFRYLLSDYNPKRPNQTTLSNSELDGIVRRLNPDLFIKIVDACHSGITYIKGEEDFTTYLKGSQAGFKNLYFMFSSQADEVSYATDRVSYFTHSVLKAVADFPDGPVRYRDLMSAASDDFAAKASGQTPQFVVQATNTEVFCEVNESLRSALRLYVTDEEVSEEHGPQKAPTLLERIKKDEEDFCTQAEAVGILQEISDTVLDLDLDSELESLFDVELEEKAGIAPSGNAIGSWLNDNAERGFFAKPTRKSEPYVERVPKNISALISSINVLGTTDDDNFRTVTKYRSVVDSYRITTEQPFGHFVVELLPKMKALSPFQCIVAPLISRTHVLVFWRYVSFDYSDWDKPVQRATSNWARAETKLRDPEGLQGILADVWEGFQSFALNPLLERWPAPPSVGEVEQTESPSEAPE